MSRKNIGILVVVVLIVVGVVFWMNNKGANSDYSVVYLSTGEVYVGKLGTFPDFQLKDAYILQVTKDAKDQTKNNFQLQPVKDALWAPKSMHFIKDNVVFYGPLMSDSKIAKALAEQTK